MNFKDMIEHDIKAVFLNADEFADIRTVKFDGYTFEDIPINIHGLDDTKREQRLTDHAQGLYRVSNVLHVASSDLGGHRPERGTRFYISAVDADGDEYFEVFYVAVVNEQGGMLRIELEGVDE